MRYGGTIDEVQIVSEENGFHIRVYTDGAENYSFRIGVPDQLEAQVRNVIGPWLEDREDARGSASWSHSVRVTEDDLEAYEHGDPKRIGLELML